MVKTKKKEEGKKVKQLYHFPDYQQTVEAENQEEALKKVKKSKK